MTVSTHTCLTHENADRTNRRWRGKHENYDTFAKAGCSFCVTAPPSTHVSGVASARGCFLALLFRLPLSGREGSADDVRGSGHRRWSENTLSSLVSCEAAARCDHPGEGTIVERFSHWASRPCIHTSCVQTPTHAVMHSCVHTHHKICNVSKQTAKEQSGRRTHAVALEGM